MCLDWVSKTTLIFYNQNGIVSLPCCLLHEKALGHSFTFLIVFWFGIWFGRSLFFQKIQEIWNLEFQKIDFFWIKYGTSHFILLASSLLSSSYWNKIEKSYPYYDTYRMSKMKCPRHGRHVTVITWVFTISLSWVWNTGFKNTKALLVKDGKL